MQHFLFLLQGNDGDLEADEVGKAFRDIYAMAATHMPKGALDEMEARLQPVLRTVKRTNVLLHEVQEQYLREKARSTILLEANAHLREKSKILASTNIK